MARPRKGCPRTVPLPQVTIHIQRRDYDSIVYKREYPNQPLHEILHKILAELGGLKEEIKDIRLELDEYKNIIKAKGLETELSKIFEPPAEKTSLQPIQEDSFNVVNQYPNWDI